MSSAEGILAGEQPRSLDERPVQQAKDWLRARVRLMPGSLSQSPPWVRGVFDHTWAPMEAMARQIQCLPAGLWEFLLHLDHGWVAIRSRETEYRPGPATIRHQTVHNVAYVSVADLAQDNEGPLHVLGHLIDHHLGCGGEAGGRWLSEGGGLVPDWQRAGERLPGLFDLGYAVDHVAGSSVQDYFAQSLALYCRRRQELNIADPQIYKWFRSTLWDTAFWRAERRLRGNEKEHD